MRHAAGRCQLHAVTRDRIRRCNIAETRPGVRDLMAQGVGPVRAPPDFAPRSTRHVRGRPENSRLESDPSEPGIGNQVPDEDDLDQQE